MVAKKYVALLLVLLLSFGQVLTAYAQIGFKVTDVFVDSTTGDVTVSGSVYSDNVSELSGQTANFSLFDSQKQPVELSNSSVTMDGTKIWQDKDLYFYDYPGQSFPYRSGETYDYNLSVGDTFVGSQTLYDPVVGEKPTGGAELFINTIDGESYFDPNIYKYIFNKLEAVVDIRLFGFESDLGSINLQGRSRVYNPNDGTQLVKDFVLTLNKDMQTNEYFARANFVDEKAYVGTQEPFTAIPLYLDNYNDIEITLQDLNGQPITSCFIGYDPNSSNNYINDSSLQSVTYNFDGTNNYVEFRTPLEAEGVPQLQNASRVRFELRGMVPEGMFLQKNIQITDVGVISLTDELGNEIETIDTWGTVNQWDMEGISSERVLECSLGLSQGQGLAYDSVYRLNFKGDLLNLLMKNINDYTFIVDGMDTENLMLDIETYEGWVSGRTSLCNEGVNGTTPVAIKQLGDSSFGINTNYVSYNADFTSGFNDVKKVVLAAQGNVPSDPSVVATEDINTFGQIDGVEASFSITSDPIETIIMNFSLPTGQTLNSVTNIQSYGNVANEFAKATRAYRTYEPDPVTGIDSEKGFEYVLVYNSLDEIIGWDSIDGNIEFNKMYTNPQIAWSVWEEDLENNTWVYNPYTPVIDEVTGLPVFVGRDNNPQKHFKIANSGTQERLILEGTVSYGTTTETFQATTNSSWQQGDEGSQYLCLNFMDITQQDFSWDTVRIEGQSSDWNNQSIPVNPLVTNTITLSYNYEINGQTYQGSQEFLWKPSSQDIADKLLNSFGFEGNYGTKVGTSSDKASIIMSKPGSFDGDLNSLKLYMYYNGEIKTDFNSISPSAFEEGSSTVCITLSVASSEQRLSESGELRTYVTFEYDLLKGDIYILNDYRINDLTIEQWQALDYNNRVFLYSTLVYDNGEFSAKRDPQMAMQEVEVDAKGPSNFGINFKGEVTENKFKIRVWADEYINLETVSENVYFSIRKKDGATISLNPVEGSVVGVHDVYQRDWEPYNAFTVEFECDGVMLAEAQERKVVFGSIADILGNINKSPYENCFYTDTHFRASVYDQNGNLMTDAQMSFIKNKPEPVILDEPDYSWQSDDFTFQVNQKGILEGWVKPGKYYGYKLSVMDDKGQWVETNIDFELDVPFADGELQYYQMPKIQINQANVTGSTSREPERSFKEELAFIDSSIYSTTYQEILLGMKGLDYYKYERALEIINKFYVKNARTDANGNFSLYLKPGTYHVLGKKISDREYLEPTTETSFTVTETGYSFVAPIAFPPPVLTGNLIDSNGSPVVNCTLEIGGQNSFYSVDTDETGYFEAYIKEAGAYEMRSVRSSWDSVGEGRFYIINATFDVALVNDKLEAQNLKGIDGISVINYENLQLPAHNVAFKLGKRDNEGELIQADKQYHSIRISSVYEEGQPSIGCFDVPSQNGDYFLYIPTGRYQLDGINSNNINIPSYWNPSTEKFITITSNGGTPVAVYETVTTDPNNGVIGQFPGYQFEVIDSGNELIEVDLSGYYDTVINFKDDDGNPMSNINVGIQKIDGYDWYNSWTDSAGNAYFYFGIDEAEEGVETVVNYRINGYDSNGKWNHLEENEIYMFTISSSNTPSNKAIKNIVIPKPNFLGTLYNNRIKDGAPVDFDGNPVEGTVVESGWINLKKFATETEQEKFFGIGTDAFGSFLQTLNEEGQYLIESAGFTTMENEQLVNNHFEIQFRFDVVLGETGKYVLVYPEGHEMAGQPIQTPLVLGRPSPNFYGYLFKKAVYTEVEVLDTLNSTKYQGFDGTETYYHAPDDTGIYMQLVEAGIGDEELNNQFWMYQKQILVREDGSFEGVLDASKTYRVWSVSTPKRGYEYGGKITIDPKTQQEYIITPPETNFGGQVATFEKTFEELRTEGVMFVGGTVSLQTADGTSWEWVGIDEDGYFGKDLVEGTTYKINDINFELRYPQEGSEFGVSKQFNFRTEKLITIGTDSVNLNLRPNFKAVINGLNIATKYVWNNQVGVVMRKVIDSNDEAYADYSMNPWKYETHFNGIYTPAVEDVDGNIIEQSKVEVYGFIDESTETKTVRYTLVRVHDTEVNETFVVAPSTTLTDSGEGTVSCTEGLYEMNLNFVSNVTGIIEEDGNPVIDAWVNLQKIAETDELRIDNSYSSQWFSTRTNQDGEFALKLGDGKYRIEGYNGQGGWVNGRWQAGEWVQVGYEFEVVEGLMQDNNGNSISNIILASNVTGKIMKPDKASATGYTQVVQNAWLQIWPTDQNGNIDYSDWSKSMWANTNSSGIFKMTLLPGGYKVTEVGGMNFNMRVDIPFVINAENQLVVNSEYIDGEGYFIVKPQKPNLFGKAYKDGNKTLLVNGQIIIKPKGDNQDNLINAKWIKTDYQGNFNTSVADGEWVITEMNSWNFWERVSIPFVVEAGVPSSQASGFSVEDGIISICPPEPNVKGIIINKDEVQLNENGWVVIKPSNADEFDWSKAIWTEYKYYKELTATNKFQFRVSLEPGSYKIVEVGGGGIYYKPNIGFVIGEDGILQSNGTYIGEDKVINVYPPEPNITGVVYGDFDGEERPVRKGWINIARYSNDVQVTMDGQPILEGDMKDQFTGIYWQHTVGFEIDEAGVFEANLNTNATYRVISVGGEGLWYQPNTEIILLGDEKANVEIRKPGPNVTITIKDVPANVASANEAWLDIFIEKGEFKNFIPSTFVQKTVNNEFVFTASMNDGLYKVNFFGTPEGKGIEIDTELQVNGTTSLEISLSSSNNHTMVYGTVTYNGNPVSRKVWVAFTSTKNGELVKKKAQTDETGNFILKLPKDTVWKLVEVVTADEYIEVTDPEAEETISIGTQNSINWNLEINDIKGE